MFDVEIQSISIKGNECHISSFRQLYTHIINLDIRSLSLKAYRKQTRMAQIITGIKPKE